MPRIRDPETGRFISSPAAKKSATKKAPAAKKSPRPIYWPHSLEGSRRKLVR